jgi:aspartate/methionine/tyrosine aminotransferase
MEFDLSWGDPVVVRQALKETLSRGFDLHTPELNSISYTPHLGDPRLIEKLKDLAQRQSGHRPKHLMITCGASGAIHAALYALKSIKTDWVVINDRYYPIYPSIIGMADMAMITRNKKDDLIKNYDLRENNIISLVDSPSAPEGLVYPFEYVSIWDAAYASQTYSSGSHTPTSWKIMCGSLSKTLGLSGLRLGWASTDDDTLARCMGIYITSSYVGLSSVSMDIANQVLDCLDQDGFEARAASYLDSNREEVQKILTKFGQGNVPTRGMFAIIELGSAERKALQRGGIKWQSGSSWGEDENWARLSLGQDRALIKVAVRSVLK